MAPTWQKPKALDATDDFERLKFIQKWYVEQSDRRDDYAWEGRLVVGRELHRLAKRRGYTLKGLARSLAIPYSWIKNCEKDFVKAKKTGNYDPPPTSLERYRAWKAEQDAKEERCSETDSGEQD